MRAEPEHQAAAVAAERRPAGARASGGARGDRGARASSGTDDLRRVQTLGDRASRLGMALGIFFAVGTHGASSARALSMLVDMRDAVELMRQELHEYFWASYAVDVEKDEEPPKPEELAPPEPEPEPAPPPPPKPDEEALPEPVASSDPYDDPPAPVEAAEIMTAPENAAPVDLTDEGFVSGHGTGPTYGYASAAGTSKTATFNPSAKVGGKEGGNGSGDRPPPPKPKVNRSRPAGVKGGKEWSCPFPAEADAEQVNRATATVVVTVAPNGSPTAVSVLSDPGYGFGRAAKQCALGRRYEPALDADGRPVSSTTPPIIVRFRR